MLFGPFLNTFAHLFYIEIKCFTIKNAPLPPKKEKPQCTRLKYTQYLSYCTNPKLLLYGFVKN